MTATTIISICLSAILAFLLGRCMYISNRRATSLSNKESEIKKLKHRLDRIADSSKYDRYYEIEEDELTDAYNVNLKVYVRVLACGHLDTVCYCLIKSFPFADDKDFALLEAQELLDKLNEK